MSRPNLLYIHTDQHTPFVTGCYGDPYVQTPNLDQLAARGVVFDNAYCNSPICVPSRMSMLTGRHPYQNQVWMNDHVLNAGIPTFAHALGAAGYQPVLAGRMHAVGPDQLHGYTERYVGDHISNYIGGTAPERGILEGTAGPSRPSLTRAGAGQSAYEVHDEYVTAAAVDYINRAGIQRRAGVRDAPFNLSIGLMLPHPPYVARREAYARYIDTLPLPAITEPFSDGLHPHIRFWRQHRGIADISEAEIRQARAAYWGLVTAFDALLGQVFDALRANDLEENTIIIYTSDHGDMVGEHSLFWKHVFYESSVRVPLIIAWPGQIAGGQRRPQMVSAIDVAATMLDMLDAPALPGVPARSLLPILKDPDAAWENVAFSEYCDDTFAQPEGAFQRMIRFEDWKLIYYHGMPSQLFYLKDDPQELVNRASDPTCAAIEAELTARVLDGWNPEAVRQQMALMRQEVDIQRQWAQHTRPEDRYFWRMTDDMNYLDTPPLS